MFQQKTQSQTQFQSNDGEVKGSPVAESRSEAY